MRNSLFVFLCFMVFAVTGNGQDITVRFGDVSGQPGEVVPVPVYLTCDRPLLGAYIGFTFDPEALVPLACESASGKSRAEVQAAAQMLQSKGLLVEGEFNVLRGLWELLQSRGPHPGLSDEEEARYRMMMVTAEARFLMARL